MAEDQTKTDDPRSLKRVVSLRWIYRGWPTRKCGVQIQMMTRNGIYAAGIAWAFPTIKQVRRGEVIQQYRLGPFIVGRKLAG